MGFGKTIQALLGLTWALEGVFGSKPSLVLVPDAEIGCQWILEGLPNTPTLDFVPEGEGYSKFAVGYPRVRVLAPEDQVISHKGKSGIHVCTLVTFLGLFVVSVYRGG